MKKKLIIGSRSSGLALWQANHVKAELEKHNRDLQVTIKIVKTKGDVFHDVALSKIGDKGLFTKELEQELLKNAIDIAVHSLKDLPTEIPKGLKLAAVSRRHAVEDVLIAKRPDLTIQTLPLRATVATGSLRRRSQLKNLRPDLKIEELRGNVPTRILKLFRSDWDAIILARAGVERLHLEEHISSTIGVDEIMPAVGQGALGIEINEQNESAEDAVQKLHDEDTFIAVSAERSLLGALEGGCQVPIGAYARVRKNGLHLWGMVAALDGSVVYKLKKRGSRKAAEKLGRDLADDLINAGAGWILQEIFKAARSH